MSFDDTRWMALALQLGRRGLGRVWPRPSVGCVIVRDGRVVGRGWTQGQTGPHGEVVALQQAGDLAQGATAYVTLEPCAHTGTTPPCADALIAAGVARVVSAMEDPDPRVAGQGHARLRAAGIAVDIGCGQVQADHDNRGFFKRLERELPVLTLKLASSFDGRIATATGESQWITGPAARRVVHGLRASHDAVLVGGGTARADDPSLTVRGLGMAHQPVRVVASRRLDLPLDSALSRSARDVPLLLVHGRDADPERIAAWTSLGAQCLVCESGPDRHLAPEAILRVLAKQGLTRVFCEGGGMLAASLLQTDVVDRLVGFTAGLALGAEGQPSLGPMGLDRLAQAPRYQLRDLRRVGAEIMHVWERADL